MKLPLLLAQYFYVNKQLDLEGIGSFVLDASLQLPFSDGEKQKKAIRLEGASFIQNTAIKTTDHLIAFISNQTGKMKALAQADLSTHIELIRQFLNIGKPFELDGIGKLAKLKSGEFVFTPGTAIVEKIKETNRVQQEDNGILSEITNTSYEPFLEKKGIGSSWKKPLIGVVIIALLGLGIWGGYTIYKKNTEAVADSELVSKATQPVSNPVSTTPIDTSLQKTPPKENITEDIPVKGQYKFVFETADSLRAYSRFEKLKSFNWDIRLETKDSIQYKLFMLLTSVDTTKTIDSLRVVYGKKPWIE